MKALLKGLTWLATAVLLWFHGEALLSNRLFLDEPTIHVVQKGEYLSDIAKRYYGNSDYWRALALINRAPNASRIYPGEKIILPDARIVAKIARAKRLSDVNEMVRLQERVAKLEQESDNTRFSTTIGGGQETPAGAAEEAVREVPEAQTSEISTENSAEPKDNAGIPAAEPQDTGQLVEATAGGGARPWLWPGGITVIFVLGLAALLLRRKSNPVAKLDGSPVEDAPLAADDDLKIGSISSDPFWDDLLAKPAAKDATKDDSID